jgi:uncharacterized protein (DUF58 family)
LFPFGFLRKSHGTALRNDALVWPAPVEYRFTRVAAARHAAEGAHVARAGASNDLLALRRYQAGDSHRLIHWKASARLCRLMVRQFAAESTATYFLRIESAPELWVREEQFELMCSFAATLAEDLFAGDRLAGASVDSGTPIVIRQVRDLESFMDQLALLEWKAEDPESRRGSPPGSGEGGAVQAAPARNNVITFAPEAARGVAAYVDGQKTATA